MEQSGRLRVHAREGPLYGALLFGWLLLTLVSCGVVVHEDWEDVEAAFVRHADHELEVLRDRLRTSEAAVDGLAAFLGSVGGARGPQLESFAEHIVRTHPQIHTVEVVERVPAAERRSFEAALASRSGGDGRLGRFDYAAGRSWGPVPHKAEYFPISFIWPDLPQSRAVLGLDFDSVPHLRAPLHRAIASGLTASSQPFELVEGPQAYVMIKPVQRDARRAAGEAPRAFAVLVVKVAALRPEKIDRDTDHRVHFAGRDGRWEVPLFALQAERPASTLERTLLPARTIEQIDFSSSQPFVLHMTRQMRLSDLSADTLVAVAILSALSLALLVLFVRQHFRGAVHEYEDFQRASHIALHDALTGLPNRNLLRDRIRQALAQWYRRREPFALFFIDIDRFKDINDRHGHEAGDAVLREVAARLAAGVRETDTVARIAGDEFVVLVSYVAGREALEGLAAKLRTAIAKPTALPDGTALEVTASLGISVCPDDGEDIDRLLDSADRAMYRCKRHA